MAKETRIVCTNVFKCGNEKAFREEFTKKWIELINQIEKNKKATIKAR